MKQYNTGMLEQAADPRDYSVRLVGAMRFPEEAIKECEVPNSDQQVGKCVMCPLEAAFTEYYGKPVGGNWGYGYFRTHKLPGLYPREAYSLAADYGLPLKGNDIAEEEVTDVIDLANGYAPRIIPLAAERAGWTYAKLHTVEEVKAAVVQSLKTKGMRIAFAAYVNAFGFLKPNNWLAYTEGGSGHMMMILGYGLHERSGMSSRLIEGVKVRNSWGEDWGDNGNCWMEWEDVLKRDEVYLLMPPATPEEPEEPQVVVQRTLRLKDKPRMQGEDVREMQTRLNVHGVACDIDGVFGPATDTAVRTFQKRKSLVVDGIVGRKTWEALRKDPVGPTPGPSERALGLVRYGYDHLCDPYGWGGNGETEITEALIRRKDTSEVNAKRTISFWQKQTSLGVTDMALFDCSGLISRYLQDLGLVSSKRNCNHLWAMCEPVTRAELREGDLLFRERGGDMYHVGIYAGRGRVIEAKGRDDGVVIRPIDASGAGYWNKFGRLNALQK